MTRVKICGLTRLVDVQLADRAGADAIGFIFGPSPRQVTADAASELSQAASPWVSRVGVFIDATLQEIEAVLRRVELDVLQLHGDEKPDFVRQVRQAFGRRIVKAIRVRDASSLGRLDEYEVDAFLFDTYVPGQAGGTGQRFDWRLAAPWTATHRIILAGGLTPANVSKAIRLVRPYGVDVSSGVEKEPGVKDPGKVTEFLAQVRSLEET